MSKVVKLKMVTVENNNKFYNMKDNGDNTFTVEYGRVGATKPQTETYALGKWDSVYKSKTKKGYKDVTELYVEDTEPIVVVKENKVTKVLNKIKRSAAVISIVKQLQSWAKVSVAENYTVKVVDVTQRQVDKAQELLNVIAKYDLKESNHKEFNKMLLEFYTVIPRKMKHTSLHLINIDKDELKTEKKKVEDYLNERKGKIVEEEQNTLDVMAGQVTLRSQEKENGITETTEEEQKDSLSISGIEMEEELDADVIKKIKKLMGDDSSKFKQAFKVVNNKTQLGYDGHIKDEKNKKSELFWHGSRNENWWSIMSSGLMIRPSNAVYTGSMFSDGVYFADKFRKSYGYSSGRNSYFAKGNSSVAILALYEVHVGEQKHIYKHTSDCYNITYQKIKKEGFDSVFAHGGADLVNNEYIIYKTAQSTIKYLVIVNS